MPAEASLLGKQLSGLYLPCSSPDHPHDLYFKQNRHARNNDVLNATCSLALITHPSIYTWIISNSSHPRNIKGQGPYNAKQCRAPICLHFLDHIYPALKTRVSWIKLRTSEWGTRKCCVCTFLLYSNQAEKSSTKTHQPVYLAFNPTAPLLDCGILHKLGMPLGWVAINMDIITETMWPVHVLLWRILMIRERSTIKLWKERW